MTTQTETERPAKDENCYPSFERFGAELSAMVDRSVDRCKGMWRWISNDCEGGATEDAGSGQATMSCGKQETPPDPSTWTVDQLQQRLTEANIDYTMCIEKQDLVELVLKHELHKTASAPSIKSNEEAVSSSAPAFKAGEEIDDCVICQDTLRLADVSMRCSGDSKRRRHYFHADCLLVWIRQSQETRSKPTCPTCRGPLQINTQRLDVFLSAQGESMKEDDKELLRKMCAAGQGDGSSGSGRRRGGDSDWEEPNWEHVIGSMLMADIMMHLGGMLVGALLGGGPHG